MGQGTGSGCTGQRLAPKSLRGDGEPPPHVTLPKEGDTSTRPESKHVQSTDLWPQSQTRTTNTTETLQPAELMYIETASS